MSVQKWEHFVAALLVHNPGEILNGGLPEADEELSGSAAADSRAQQQQRRDEQRQDDQPRPGLGSVPELPRRGASRGRG
jgi:hypothetical protein